MLDNTTEIKVSFIVDPLFEMYQDDYKTRKISVRIQDEQIAVINTNQVHGKWTEPKFVVLKGPLSYIEMTGLGFAMRRAQELMKKIGTPDLDIDELNLEVEKADGVTYGP